MKGGTRKQIKRLKQQRVTNRFRSIRGKATKLHLDLTMSENGKLFTVSRKSGAWIGVRGPSGLRKHPYVPTLHFATLAEIIGFLAGYEIALYEGVAEKELLG